MTTSARPIYRQSAASLALPPDSICDGMRAIVTRLRVTVPNLSPRDSEKLSEIARADRRYGWYTLRWLCGLSKRSVDAADREALGMLILSECWPDHTPAIRKAFDRETPSTGQADVEQRAFELRPDPITAARCRTALERQLATTRDALEAVIEWQRTSHGAAGQGEVRSG